MNSLTELVHESPDVYRVIVPFDGPGIAGTNCYIVRDGDETLVVDAGAPGDGACAVMRAAFEETGVDPARASFFLTHFHTDHSGLLDRIAPPEAAVFVNLVDFDHMLRSRTEVYRDELFDRMRAEGMPASELAAHRAHLSSLTAFDPSLHDVRFVSDGDTISCGRWRFAVLETPGHTVGHQSLVHPESGIVFGGDAVLFVISSSVDFVPRGAQGLQTYLDSLDRLIACPEGPLLHSHGDIRPAWRERAVWLKEHRIERLEDAFRAAAVHDGSTGYEIVRRIRWNVPFDAWEDISLMQRWAIVGEGLGYVDHLVSLGQVRREADADGTYRYFVHSGCAACGDREVHRREGRAHCLLR